MHRVGQILEEDGQRLAVDAVREIHVRVVEHQPSLAELRNNYLADAYSWYGENIMNQMHRQEVASNLENDIEVRTNLKWDRAADQAKNEQRDEG